MDWKQKLSDAVGAAVAEPEQEVRRESGGSAAKQRQWSLRYKEGNHPAETGLILASSRERAEEVGRTWCLKRSSGKMQACRFIAVDDPILADESILNG